LVEEIDIIYHVTDLTAEMNRKILLEDESKEGLVTLVSEIFEKPLFKVYLREEEKDFLEDKMKHFKFVILTDDTKFKMGDFLLTMQKIGGL